MNIESRLSEVAKRWIDEEEGALLGHPESAIWSRYNAGELAPEEIERLRDHLVSCRSCRSAVFEAPKFGTTIVPEPGATLAQSDEEVPRAWHALRRRVEDPIDRTEETEPVEGVPRAAPPARGRLTWLPTMVAVLSLSFAGWVWHQANQPRLGVVIAEAVPAGSSRGDAAPGGSAQGGEEGKGRSLALLVPLPPDLAVGTPVRVEILDEDGAVEWRGESRSIAEGEFGLEIPPRYRRAGYQVRLSVPAGEGDAGETWKVLGTFGLPAPAGDSGEAATP